VRITTKCPLVSLTFWLLIDSGYAKVVPMRIKPNLQYSLRIAVPSLGLFLLCGSLLAQNPGWETPRTAFGQPDMQGYWSNATQTPLERPRTLGTQRAYNEEEAQTRENRARAAAIQADDPLDPDRSAPEPGDLGTYDRFWLDLGTRISRIDGEYRTSMIIEPEDGRIPYLPVAERKPNQLARWLSAPGVEAFDGPELQTIGERCLLFFDFRTSNSGSGPPMMPMYYNNNYQIIQTEDYVVIVAEMINDARIIRLQGDHQPAVMKKWMGDSIGHWDGDTLVISTRNLHPQQSHFGASDNVVITERLRRSSEGQLDYTFTIEDAAVYASPWTAQMAWHKKPDSERLYEYACHEGNYALTGILAGARREELREEP